MLIESRFGASRQSEKLSSVVRVANGDDKATADLQLGLQSWGNLGPAGGH
jgi:hypothetical protein